MAHASSQADARGDGPLLTYDANPPPPSWLDAAPPPPPSVSHASLTLPCGAAYTGDALDGTVPHGQGTLTRANGDTYTGGWREGAQAGKGVAAFADGRAYDGEWEGGAPHGHGRATYPNGGFYVGDFAAGLRAGWGRHAFGGGGWYEGPWAADAPHGAGVWVDADGGRFVGTFAAGERVRGAWSAGDGGGGACYEGEWGEGGVPSGRGTGTLPLGPPGRYTGTWAAGLPSGVGVARYVDGSSYDGEWADGLPHGPGALTRPDGSFYKGAWRAGREHGVGRALTRAGVRYEGGWADGEPHGAGRERTPGGEAYEGGFARGRRAGRGRCVAPDGASYDGDWADGARHGHGVAVFADGTVFEGAWRRGAWVQSGAAARRCRVAGPPIDAARAVAGAAAAFTIAAVDDAGQPRLSGGDGFAVWVAHADGSRADGTVADRGDGGYDCLVRPTRAGAAEIHVRDAGGAAVADSPYGVYVAAGDADAGATLVEWPRPPAGAAGAAAPALPLTLRVGVRDACGNTLPAADALRAVSGEVCVWGAVVALCFGDGGGGGGWLTAPLALPPPPVAAVLEVRIGGRRVPGSPRSVLVGEGGAAGAPPPRDGVREWGRLADALGAADDENEAPVRGDEDAAPPGVPVVEDLTDLWLVSKLQRERGVVR